MNSYSSYPELLVSLLLANDIDKDKLIKDLIKMMPEDQIRDYLTTTYFEILINNIEK